ncbi:MAG: GNAT family N-acetyltransferase [Polyangiaceae bacterium]
MTAGPYIRVATATDVGEILALIRDLAEYEREPQAVTATTADLLRDGFGENPRFHVLLACLAGEGDATESGAGAGAGEQIAGFAFYFFAYSTWRAQPTLYLEDLFVRPAYRRHGLGIALMRRLAAEAVKTGCGRFQWQVLDWNEPAVRFYESLGGKVLKEWWTVRVEGDAIAALAESR